MDHCGKGCQVDYGLCWKNDDDHDCAAPILGDGSRASDGDDDGFHLVAFILVWFPGIHLPGLHCPLWMKILKLCPLHGSWCKKPNPADCFPDIELDNKKTKHHSHSKDKDCTTTYTATHSTLYCSAATTWTDKSTTRSRQKTCTKTKTEEEKACSPVVEKTTTKWDHCKGQTATDITYFVSVGTKTIDGGELTSTSPITTTTKTMTDVYSGCEVSATTTTIIAKPSCPAIVGVSLDKQR